MTTTRRTDDCVSASVLAARGWTPAAVRRFLGGPDRTGLNPMYRSTAPMRLFSLACAVAAENTAQWQQWRTKAAVVVAEDLSRSFTGRRPLGRNTNRRLAAWTKGVTAEALTSVSERRGSSLVLVNPAYTSQACPGCAALGRRDGDRLHCTWCRVVGQADRAAAINILCRHGDPDITVFTPYQTVRRILQDRADRHRTRLPVQDSNRPTPAVESEPSNPCPAMSND